MSETYLEKQIKKQKDNSQWVVLSDKVFTPCPQTQRTLPSGFYKTSLTPDNKVIFENLPLENDTLIEIPNDKILEEIKQFWDNAEAFKQNGFLHKRGILFTGSAGCGKSSYIRLLISELIKRDGIVVNCDTNPNDNIICLKALRAVEPNRLLICLFEDIDDIVDIYGEKSVLSLLDGEYQIDHVLNIATTNFPEKLEERIKNRPRRFDRFYVINSPDKVLRKKFIKEKFENLSDEEIEVYLRKTENFTFAELTEFVISINCFKYTVDEAIEVLNGMNKQHLNSKNFNGSGSIGFNNEDKKD